MNRFFRAAVLAAACCLPLLGVTAASAGPHVPTNACSAEDSDCLTPVDAVAQPSSEDFNPADDAGMTADVSAFPFLNNAVVSMNPNNDLLDGSQDWVPEFAGEVPYPGSETTIFGLNQHDFSLYGGDEIYQLQLDSFGFDTGYCLQITTANVGVLRSCSTSRRQLFIAHYESLPGISAPSYDYAFAALVAHAPTSLGHWFLRGPTSGNGQVTVHRLTNFGPGNPSPYMWSAN